RGPSLARKSLAVSVLLGASASLLLPLSGDVQARLIARLQPAKLAAFEGLYRSQPRAPLTLFGIPDGKRQKLRAELAVPGLLSWLVHRRLDAPVTGLDAFPPGDRPPVAASYWLFHSMVGCGLLLAALFCAAAWGLRGGRLYGQRWLLKALVGSVVPALAANELGWCAAEVGRQPWIVYGLLRTRDAVSRSVPAPEVLLSITLFALIYALLLAVWLSVLDDKIRRGPEELPAAVPARGWLESAAQLADPAGGSLTEAKEEP
ncbi:MAG: cytochrome ubiquinol oxidase subunit I, partial [Elusimicrobia bacterium]|nr:cytochrome ubiquinol oxidase subunit I [Elusimicrobiota bacterium]